MIKIRAYADLHLFHDLNTMDDYINNELNDIINQMMTNKVDLIVFCGDLAHTTYQSSDRRFIEILNFVKRIVEVAEKTGTLIRIIQGTSSHDGKIVDILKLMFKDYSIIKCINKVKYEKIGDVVIRYLPECYFATYSEFSAYAFSRLADITFFHGSVEGVIPMLQQKDSVTNLPKSVVISRNDLLQKTTLFSAGGHIHKHINLNGKIFYINSLTAHNFSDVGDIKGYMEFEVNDDLSFKYIYIENFKGVKYIDIPIENINTKNKEEIRSLISNLMLTYKPKDNIRFILTGIRNIEAMSNIAFIKSLTTKYNIKIKDKLEEPEIVNIIDEDSDYYIDKSISIVDKIYKILIDTKHVTIDKKIIEDIILKGE